MHQKDPVQINQQPPMDHTAKVTVMMTLTGKFMVINGDASILPKMSLHITLTQQ